METLVTTLRPRPSVHNNYSKHGHQYWTRDVHHALASTEKTYCGRDASEWVIISEEVPTDTALQDHNLCIRCANKMRKQ
jgi:hypothetical protein